jgi:hypothetical protein
MRPVIGKTVVEMLPAAVAFALSPAALVEMILVLLSKRARTNSIVFLVAVVFPVFAVPFLGAAGMSATESSDSSRSTTEGLVLLVLAGLLALLAARNFGRRRDSTAPAIFDRITDIGPVAVLLLAPGVTVLNPKNLMVLLGAGAVAGRHALSTTELAVAVGAFAVFATLPFLVVVGYVQLGGEAATASLVRWREWLMRHNRLIMAAVLGVLAVVLAAQGLAAVL